MMGIFNSAFTLLLQFVEERYECVGSEERASRNDYYRSLNAYDDLKMNETPSFIQTLLSSSATRNVISSDSITHGPAIKNKGWSMPTLKFISFTYFPFLN